MGSRLEKFRSADILVLSFQKHAVDIERHIQDGVEEGSYSVERGIGCLEAAEECAAKHEAMLEVSTEMEFDIATAGS